MELLSRTADIWNEKPTMAPKQTVRPTDDQGFTLVTSKKADGLKRGPGRPRKVVEAPVPPTIPATTAPPSGPTLRTLRRPTPSEEVPSLFNFS